MLLFHIEIFYFSSVPPPIPTPSPPVTVRLCYIDAPYNWFFDSVWYSIDLLVFAVIPSIIIFSGNVVITVCVMRAIKFRRANQLASLHSTPNPPPINGALPGGGHSSNRLAASPGSSPSALCEGTVRADVVGHPPREVDEKLVITSYDNEFQVLANNCHDIDTPRDHVMDQTFVVTLHSGVTDPLMTSHDLSQTNELLPSPTYSSTSSSPPPRTLNHSPALLPLRSLPRSSSSSPRVSLRPHTPPRPSLIRAVLTSCAVSRLRSRPGRAAAPRMRCRAAASAKSPLLHGRPNGVGRRDVHNVDVGRRLARHASLQHHSAVDRETSLPHTDLIHHDADRRERRFPRDDRPELGILLGSGGLD